MPPTYQPQSNQEHEQMYFQILAHKLEESQKKFLTRAIFENEENFLSSVDLSGNTNPFTQIDVDARDQDFLLDFTTLLKDTSNMKINQTVLDSMFQSLYKTAQNSQSSIARKQITFLLALLTERKFFINLLRSLLRIVVQATFVATQFQTSKPPIQVPQFENDPFLEEEFKKLAQVRSLSSQNAHAQTKQPYTIARLLQPSSANQNISQRDLRAKQIGDAEDVKKLMFDRNKFPAHENSEYQGSKIVSDKSLGINIKPKHQQGETFSFAENFKAPGENIYKKDGVLNRVSNSPSFGHLSNKSPHSQQPLRQSRKKSVLKEYNQLFKRIETVQLKHKWETDDEDVAADVTGSSQESGSAADGVRSDDERTALESKKQNSHHSKQTPSINTRRGVQKPEQKDVVIGKRANVRNSGRKPFKNTSIGTQQRDSISPNKQQQAKQQTSQGLLFSQNKNKKENTQQKISSRNSKNNNLYTKSVPSLTQEKGKSKEISIMSGEGDKKVKQLKEASLALAMTISPPKSQQKSGPHATQKKIANPQYSSSKFEMTQKSMSSQKKKKGARSDSSPNSKDEPRHESSSTHRYYDKEHKESMCEPNELVQQLKQEQDLEYVYKSSQHLTQGPLLPTENGAIYAGQLKKRESQSNSRKAALIPDYSKQETSGDQDEYELLKAKKSNRHSRVISTQLKQSQSKLLPTGGQILEGATQPKKLEKDAKLFFPQSTSGQKKLKFNDSKIAKQTGAPVVESARRNIEYSGDQDYQIKNIKEQKGGETGLFGGGGLGNNTKFTSDAGSVQKQSPKVSHHLASQSAHLMQTAITNKQKLVTQPQISLNEKKQVSNSGVKAFESTDTYKNSKPFVPSPDLKSANKVKSAVEQLAEIDKRAPKNTSQNQSIKKQAIPANDAYGGIRHNTHDESSYASSIHQKPGAYPVHSEKSSIKPMTSFSKSHSSFDYDKDDDDDEVAQKNEQHIARYTQGLEKDELFSSSKKSGATESLVYEHGPQTFQKGDYSEDDGEEVRQLIVLVKESTDQDDGLRMADAKNMFEPDQSEKSVNEQSNQSQIHDNFYNNKPTESVAQSFQHDEILPDDFEDEGAMFEHLRQSTINRDDGSRQETSEGDNFFQKENQGEPSEKASFNISLIQPTPAELSRVKGVISNKSSRHQFSVHQSMTSKKEHDNTHGTIRHTVVKHNMILVQAGSQSVRQSGTSEQQFQARPPLSKQNVQKTSTVNSSVRSVGIDLDQKLKPKMKQNTQANSSSIIVQSQQLTRALPEERKPNSERKQQIFFDQQKILANNSAQQPPQNEGFRNQTMKTQVSQDFFSEESMANQTDLQNDNDYIENPADQLEDDEREDAERAHKLSQVKMELFRGQEIRNSKKRTFSNRHLSSSSSEKSGGSAQFKKQLNNIKMSQEQSPSANRQRLRKDHRRKLFCGGESSSEHNQEEQEQQYRANDSNAVEEYAVVNISKQKPAQNNASLIKSSLSPASSVLRHKRASQNSSSKRHYFGMTSGNSDPELSSGGSLSQEDHGYDYNKFKNNQRQRRL